MLRLVYTLLIYLASPLVLYLTFRPQRGKPGYGRRWAELLGFVPRQTGPAPLWIHTVSVGETLAASPLIRELRARYPDLPLLITTTTRTGADQVAKLGDGVRHLYAPLDYPGTVARFLRRTQPRGLVIMETELWPNWLAACRRRSLPVVVMNARLSERSCQRYQKVRSLVAGMAKALTRVLCQHREDAARFARLGLQPAQIQVTGSLKFDIRLDATLVAAGEQARRQLGGRPVWLAASTHPGEDEQLLTLLPALRARYPDSLLILVPRHPVRFDPVAKLCRDAGWALARRSLGEAITAETAIYLADTMGEMPLLLQMSDVTFLGGSLVPVGGHNLLEPASLGKPTLIGPHSFNFSDVTRQLCDQNACIQVADVAALGAELGELLGDTPRCQEMGMRGFDVVAANQGAQAQTLAALVEVFGLDQASPR